MKTKKVGGVAAAVALAAAAIIWGGPGMHHRPLDPEPQRFGAAVPEAPEKSGDSPNASNRSASAMNLAPSAATDATAGSPMNSTQAVVEPTSEQLHPAFTRLFRERPGPTVLHAELVAEQRDPDWASDMEEQWRRYYEGKPELLRYGTPEIHCGRTLCEIRMLAYSVPEKADWLALLSGSGANPMPKEGIPNGVDLIQDNGVTAVAAYIRYRR